MNDVVAGFASPLREAVSALRREIAEIEFTGARGGHCARTTLAVALSVIVALYLRVDAPWWAAISAFVSIQVSSPVALRRTFVGAGGGVVSAGRPDAL